MEKPLFLALDGLMEELHRIDKVGESLTNAELLAGDNNVVFARFRIDITWFHCAVALRQAHDLNRIATALEELVRR